MNKIGLMLAMTISVGIFALPATMAYLSGQHTFVAPAYVNCEKCHGNIGDEYAATGSGPHYGSGMACQDCHITASMRPSSTNPADKQGHASVAVECWDCHGASIRSINISVSGTDHPINSPDAAHYQWFLDAANDSIPGSDLNYGSNEVCIGCHTHAGVNITWTAPAGGLTFNQNSREFGYS